MAEVELKLQVKRLEEEVERLRKDLRSQTSGLEAANKEMEAFTYSVTHDLRKPLTIINGYCQVIKDLCVGSLDEQCNDYIDKIYYGTVQMNQLIDALLKFSLLGRGELRREMVNLSDIASSIAAELRIAEPERRVTFHIAEGIVVNGDAVLLRVVLDNLIGNAWKYTSKREEAVIELGVTEHEGKSTCFVRDNGLGFDMADAEKLFIPFQRLAARDEVKGHGIGLATVHRIIQRHGGRIWAEGKPGEGATFYFYL